jgi:hypothetical protein
VAAYHEASHAAAAAALNMPLSFVDLEQTLLLSPRPVDKRWLMFNLAGPLGQASFQANLNDDCDDIYPEILEAYHQLRTQFDENAAIEQLELYMHRTVHLLEIHWERVERIAEALLRRGRLSGYEVMRL